MAEKIAASELERIASTVEIIPTRVWEASAGNAMARALGPLLELAKAVKNDGPEVRDENCGCPNCVALAAVERVVALDE